VQKGPLWSLALTVPPSAGLPVEVTLNFQGPMVDAPLLQAFTNRMASMPSSASADAAKRFEQQVQQKIIADQQAQTML
jgi:hypothetical protein